MGYLNEDGLARYDGLIKQWVTFKSGTVDGIDPLLNWQKTSTAASATCYPLPAAPIDPTVNFLFTETSPVGEKSPTNPSTITGVSSITVTRCETAGVDSTDYTVALGDTYYGGRLDLASGTLTLTHVMVEPDSLSYDISAHPANAGSFQYADTFGRTVTTDGNTLTITGETGGQIVYNIATPEAVSLSPLQIYSLSQFDPYTPRINTVYSDQVSVQVGYPKSPLATATELTNAIISLGGNV